AGAGGGVRARGVADAAVLAGDEHHRGGADGGDLLGVVPGAGHGPDVGQAEVVDGGGEQLLDAGVEGHDRGLGHPFPDDLDAVAGGELVGVAGGVLFGGCHVVVVRGAPGDGQGGFVRGDGGLPCA